MRLLFLPLLIAFAITLTSPALAITPEEAATLRQAIQAFAHEPDIYQVQEAALRHRDLHGDRQDRWTTRARLSSLLPHLQGQASWLDQRDQRNRFRENITADEDGFYERNYAQHYLYDDLRLRGLYSLRATFDLRELLFHRQELGIQREVHARWSARDKLLHTVTELYFARRRHQIHLRLLPPADIEEALERQLTIHSLTARIDALTGGWFRQAIEEDRL